MRSRIIQQAWGYTMSRPGLNGVRKGGVNNYRVDNFSDKPPEVIRIFRQYTSNSVST